jgi:Zn-dependent peptidase ImmA (M78 family)/DNA-binding XRE family transcriptional regulator
VSADASSAAALFDPDRLRLARQLAGLKRSQLAERVGLSAAAITQYENRTNRPRPATLAQLALTLGMPVAFFADVGRPLDALPLEQTFFRSLRRTKLIERELAAAHATLLAELVRLVDQKVKLPSVDVPEDLTLRSEDPIPDAETVADELRRRWQLNPEPIENTVRLLERHGVVVARLALGSHDVDAFSWAIKRRPLVLLSSDKDTRERSRRDALHELGHLVMHHADPEAGCAPLERQAERFASALLVPAEALREEWPQTTRLDWSALMRLKHRWGMSLGALLYRAHELELLSPTTYQSAIKYMSKRGWRLREPGAASAPERPRLLGQAIRLMEQSGVDLQEMLEAAGLPPRDQILAMLQVEPAGPRRLRVAI